MNRDDVRQSLVELYAEEVDAALRYLHMAITLEDTDRARMRERALEMMSETLAHAEVVARKAIELGADPHLRLHVDLPGDRVSAEEALSHAVAFETAARDAYAELAEKAAGDRELRDFALTQAKLEDAHLRDLEAIPDA